MEKIVRKTVSQKQSQVADWQNELEKSSRELLWSNAMKQRIVEGRTEH